MVHARKLKWIAASLFCAWHTLALVLAPAPGSDVVMFFYRIVRPYVYAFKLNNQWKYFAAVGYGGNVDYEIVDGGGEKSRFTMPPQYDHRNQGYFQYFHIQNEFFGSKPPKYLLQDVAHYYCRRHAALRPRQVAFILRIQKAILPDDFKKGFTSADKAFVREINLDPIECPETGGRT